jgi:hypothetical protein
MEEVDRFSPAVVGYHSQMVERAAARSIPELVDSEEEEGVVILANRAVAAADIRVEVVEPGSARLVVVVVHSHLELRLSVQPTPDKDISL